MGRFSTQLSGAHVLVTGGTKGLGRIMVQAFLAEGANVSYCARTVQGHEFAHFKDAIDGARGVGSTVDLSNLGEVDAWVAKSVQEFGRLDVVVANASSGISEPTIEAWQSSFQTEILSLITLIDACVPHLKKQSPNSSIVVLGSLAGYEARHPHHTGPYPTLKRAQSTLAQGYARQLGPDGIRVNVVVPGGVKTPGPVLPDGSTGPSTADIFRKQNPEADKAVLQSMPLGRRGAAEDVANAVVFLGSRLAASTTGTTLFVDSGLSMSF